MPQWAQIVLGMAAVVTAMGVLWTKVLRPGARLISTTEEMLPLLRTLTATFRDTPDSLRVLSEIAQQFKTDSGSSLRDVVNRLEKMAHENRQLLDLAARELRSSDETLKVGVETTKQLAAVDRESQRQLMLVVDRLTTQIQDLTTAGIKLDVDRAQVAEDLVAREKKIDRATSGVATDLTERQRQVDEASGGLATDLTERQRRIDEASGGVADDLTRREAKIDTASSVVAADLAASQTRAADIGATGGSGPGAAADAASLPSTPEERRQARREAEAARRAQWEMDEENDEDGE